MFLEDVLSENQNVSFLHLVHLLLFQALLWQHSHNSPAMTAHDVSQSRGVSWLAIYGMWFMCVNGFLVNKCFLIENWKHCHNAEVVVALTVWMPNGVRQWCCYMSVFSTPCAFLTMLLLWNWFIHGGGFQYMSISCCFGGSFPVKL